MDDLSEPVARALVRMAEVMLEIERTELYGYDREQRTKTLSHLAAALNYERQNKPDDANSLCRGAALAVLILALADGEA
jgi:hypothetical protein